MTARDEAQILDGLFGRIESAEVRLMLYDAILFAPRLQHISVRMYSHGYMASVRIEREAAWAFSLVPARQWLLLYVRHPELQRGLINFDYLSTIFPNVKERPDGELTVRLLSREDIARLIELIAQTS